jgi:xylulokinase
MPIDYPRPLWAEVDPEAWWQGAVQVVRETLARSEVTPEQIAGVGLSGLMHAPVLLDGEGRPVTPAMLWLDQRCAPQCEALNHESQLLVEDASRRSAEVPPSGGLGGRRIGQSRSTSLRFSTTLSAPKLRWLADTQPDVLAQARTLLLPKDFVRYRLTNTICTDASDAGGTGLFDREREVWDWQAVRLARAPKEILPPIRPSWALAGRVTPDAARETGLAAGTKVAVGGSDVFCTRMGIGELAAREVCIYLGTAAWIALVDGIGPDGRPIMRGFGATATTGAALRWIRDLLVGEANTPPERGTRVPPSGGPGGGRRADVSASYDALTRQAEGVSPGAEGLFFLPHLMGERGPQADPLARGALVGLTLRHGRPQIVRAVLEGTAFHLRRLLEARTASHWPAGGPTAGAASGGVARSPFWMQLLADITQLPLRVPAVVEAGVLGAAMLGGVAAGVVSRATASSQMVRTGRTYVPNAAVAPRYDALYARYCRLDDLLAPWFREAGPGES